MACIWVQITAGDHSISLETPHGERHEEYLVQLLEILRPRQSLLTDLGLLGWGVGMVGWCGHARRLLLKFMLSPLSLHTFLHLRKSR